MKHGVVGSLLLVSLLGAVACGDDAEPSEVEENAAASADSGTSASAGGGSSLDGGAPMRPSWGDEDPRDGGRDDDDDDDDDDLSVDGGRRGPRDRDGGRMRPPRDAGRRGGLDGGLGRGGRNGWGGNDGQGANEPAQP